MNMTRRRLIQVGLGAGGGLLFGGMGVLAPRWWRDGAAGAAGQLHVADRSAAVFGTQATVRVLHADRTLAEAAAEAAVAELQTVQRVMSLYQPDSQLCQLNRDGGIDHAHPYLLAVLEQARAVSQWSDGAFDVTVQPIWQTYAQARADGALPDARQLATAVERVNWQKVRIKPGRILLEQPGMAVTLNGIAQGFAADRVAEVLKQHGIAHALINSGEVLAMGRRADQSAWQVGVTHPRRDGLLTNIGLTDRCLATSGDYATAFSNDFKHHHIVRPTTGQSPNELASVTVAAESATWADALSTALFVLGPARGLELIASIDGADALFVFKDMRQLATAGLGGTNHG